MRQKFDWDWEVRVAISRTPIQTTRKLREKDFVFSTVSKRIRVSIFSKPKKKKTKTNYCLMNAWNCFTVYGGGVCGCYWMRLPMAFFASKCKSKKFYAKSQTTQMLWVCECWCDMRPQVTDRVECFEKERRNFLKTKYIETMASKAMKPVFNSICSSCFVQVKNIFDFDLNARN